MRWLEYGKADDTLGIEGKEVFILNFGFAGDSALRFDANVHAIKQVIKQQIEQSGEPEYWPERTVAEIPFNHDNVVLCGLAVTNWILRHKPLPDDPVLNPFTVEYAALERARTIADNAQESLSYFRERLEASMANQEFTQSQH